MTKMSKVNGEEYVTMTKGVYESFLEDSLWLSCLEKAGVDNWDGWDYAREFYEEVKEAEEID